MIVPSEPQCCTPLPPHESVLGSHALQPRPAVQPFTHGSLDQPEGEFPRYIVGTPETVRDQLLHIARELEIGELIVNTITHSHQARLRSYELLAEAFDRANRIGSDKDAKAFFFELGAQDIL